MDKQNNVQLDIKEKLSLLWIFVTVNYIFCDVFTLMYSEELKQILLGNVGGVEITQNFLLIFAFLMEIPMAMIFLSRILKYEINRLANVIAGLLLTFIQASTLFTGTSTLHYVFFSIIEVATTAFIVWIALTWNKPAEETDSLRIR